MQRLVVLVSGGGSNLLALLTAIDAGEVPAEVVAVGADRPCDGLEHARSRGIPTWIEPFTQPRLEWSHRVFDRVEADDPDLLILSGFMRLFAPGAVARMAPRILNTHPAFLPEFPGAHGVRDALAAGVEQSGASVIVVDEGVDSGPVLAQERVPVLPGDDEDALFNRIKPVERRLLADVIRRIDRRELDLEQP